MSGDNRSAEAVSALDEWYSRRVDLVYTGTIAKKVLELITREAKGLPEQEMEALQGDFARTFPLRTWLFNQGYASSGYFSNHYSRFEGYLEQTLIGGGEEETNVLKTMDPIFDARKKELMFIGMLAKAAGTAPVASLDDSVIDNVFRNTFHSLAEFTCFCSSYLRTRVMNAHARSLYANMPQDEHAIRARNFRRVGAAVSFFAGQVVGDIVH